jgi:hypothetical protein
VKWLLLNNKALASTLDGIVFDMSALYEKLMQLLQLDYGTA